MTPDKVLRTVRLRITNQARMVNQIAGTYKDVYRALMEYVDNSADAAAIDPNKPRHLRITVDTTKHEVTFEDDCAGMSPEKVGEILESIGTSTKAHLPWVNGEFGFGVHAFRAFAQYAEVTSRTAGSVTCSMLIDREADEHQKVPISEVDSGRISTPSGTRITVRGFRKGVFKGPYFASSLRKEIEDHFDDVIQNGILEVSIRDTRAGSYDVCKPVEIGSLAGTPIRLTLPVEADLVVRNLEVDAKLIDGPPLRHPIVLTRNGRRILPVGEIRSFRNYLRGKDRLPDVWGHPQVMGRIEIGDIAVPNITRDDLQPGEGRDALFEALGLIQNEIEGAVTAVETKHRDRQLDSASKVLSERLAHVMRRFSATFRRPVAAPGPMDLGGGATSGVAPGGPLPGGGGAGDIPDAGSGRPTGEGGTGLGKGGLGHGSRGAHDGGGPEGQTGGSTLAPAGPELLFSHLDPTIRCRLVGYKINVNLDHPDYLARVGKEGLDERTLAHVARVVSPVLTEKIYETKGTVPTPIEFGEKVVDLSIMLEDDFMSHESEIALAMRLSDGADETGAGVQ